MYSKPTYYFEKAGDYTDKVLEIVKNQIVNTEIEHIVVASSTGYVAQKAYDKFKDIAQQLVIVGEHSGFKGGDTQLFDEGIKKILEQEGIPVFIGSHALSGIERSITNRFGGISRVEMIAHTLRQVGCEGIKVCVEIAVMAADAGLMSTDKEVIAIAGTGKGADTAVILKPAHMNNYFDLEIREIIVKPRQRKK